MPIMMKNTLNTLLVKNDAATTKAKNITVKKMIPASCHAKSFIKKARKNPNTIASAKIAIPNT